MAPVGDLPLHCPRVFDELLVEEPDLGDQGEGALGQSLAGSREELNGWLPEDVADLLWRDAPDAEVFHYLSNCHYR